MLAIFTIMYVQEKESNSALVCFNSCRNENKIIVGEHTAKVPILPVVVAVIFGIFAFV